MKNAFEYEAELAALREEADQFRESSAQLAGDLLIKQQRLADAERRNVLVESLLRESLEEDDGTSDWLDRVIAALRERPIDAALNKPESGASE